jgi:hypothetical protein
VTYYEKWLRDVAFFKTRKGARLDLRLYIYPDGHGNIHYKTLDTGEDRNQPVSTPREAADILQALWTHGQAYGLTQAPPGWAEE